MFGKSIVSSRGLFLPAAISHFVGNVPLIYWEIASVASFHFSGYPNETLHRNDIKNDLLRLTFYCCNIAILTNKGVSYIANISLCQKLHTLLASRIGRIFGKLYPPWQTANMVRRGRQPGNNFIGRVSFFPDTYFLYIR